MTTIAYRNKVLAGDTRVTSGDLINPEVDRKVFRLRNGRLFGAAGKSEHCTMMKAAASKPGPLTTPEFDGESDVAAIVIDVDETVWYTEGEAWARLKAPYVALGTGSVCALVAMWLGHDAKTAVRAGIAHDKNSGGRVLSVKLK